MPISLMVAGRIGQPPPSLSSPSGERSLPTRINAALPFAEHPSAESNGDWVSGPSPNSLKDLTSVAPREESCATFNSVAVAEPATGDDDFAFTIAIGRIATKPRPHDGRLMIEVSSPNGDFSQTARKIEERGRDPLYRVASLAERKIAGAIDLACLLFACGGFLTLFGSLGGHLTLSKLSAAVFVTALAVVYAQYFALFTIFGGTTPGMMFRGLQVMSFTGEAPTPRQMLLRSVGYLLSAAACFTGFLWVLWDQDELTWHDRFSRTYLSSAQTYAEIESHGATSSLK